MEKYMLQNDLTVFGMQVKTFPQGIDEAFKGLIKMLSGKFDRSFYGIGEWDGKNMIYRATAVETYKGEADKYPSCEKYIIEKGEYLIVPVTSWRAKTDTIKEVFHTMMQDSRVNKTKPSVEWYKNDEEMWCMVKMVPKG